MKLCLIKTAQGALIPGSEDTARRVDRLPVGKALQGDFKKMRNPKYHRKYFAMIQYVFWNQERVPTLEHLLTEIKIRTGHYEEHITQDGKIVYTPKSICFEKMDDIEFHAFYEKTINAVIAGGFFQGDDEQIRQAIEQVAMGF